MEGPVVADPGAPSLGPSVQLSHRDIVIILLGLGTGLLLAALDQTIVSTALPTIVGELGGLSKLSWVVTAYMLTSTASTPLYGKLSDQFGRKQLFQAAIVIFLVGSVLCGQSRSMTQLVAFRAIQGLGAGGLMALTFVIIGDLVPPRQRGRYTGYLTGVFAISSVAGPLAGGFLVDNLSWRWVFYVNLPIGLVALVVTSIVLKLPVMHMSRRVDVEGALLLVSSVSCLLLVTVWGGREYEWTSPTILSLSAASLLLAIGFVMWERRAAEPILPLRLFSGDVFRITSIVSFLIGAGMFGGTVFLPLYLQAVQGTSATNSGLLMLPMMGGVLVMSIAGGRIITRTGHYKRVVVIGCGLAAVGMILLSLLDEHSSFVQAAMSMFIVGAGLGMVMPVLTLATQNAVTLMDLGSATAAVNFFRSLGGAIGVAAFGAVLSNSLASELAKRLPGVAGARTASLASSPEQIAQLPLEIQVPVIESLAAAVHRVFLTASPVMLLAFLAAWLLREVPLRDSHLPQPPPQATDLPATPEVAETGPAQR